MTFVGGARITEKSSVVAEMAAQNCVCNRECDSIGNHYDVIFPQTYQIR